MKLENCSIFTFLLFLSINVSGQNSLVGDGFGGRLWYQPLNIAAGCYSAYAVCGDENQLYSWGHNLNAELGTGSTLPSTTPVKVLGMDDVFFYSAGYMSGVIKGDLSAWVWGISYDSVPFKLMDDVRFLNAGENSITFVKMDGTVWSLGNNRTGQFGNGDSGGDTAVAGPQKMNDITTAVRVANGFYSTAILLENGDVYAVGRNYHGELGQDPSVVDSRTPIKISPLKDIVDLKATAFGFAALDKNGDVYGWGKWVEGQPVYIPQKMPGLSNIVSISGKNDGWHFMAISNVGNCYAWGRNQYAQLGIGDASLFKFDPVLVATDVVEICAGETFSYLIKSNGKMYGTGRGKQGSIWMNLPNVTRFSFTEINNEVAPMYMCKNKKQINLIVDRVICEGESVRYGGKTYDETGRYFDRLKGSNGDTLLVLNVLQGTHKTYNNDVKLGGRNSLIVGNHTYSEPGVYTDTLVSNTGCDSIIVSHISKFTNSSFSQSDTICQNQLYEVGRSTYTEFGNYIDTLVNSQGCDSVVSSNLLVVAVLKTHNRYDLCAGENVVIDNVLYDESTELKDSFVNIYGCDSIILNSIVVHKSSFIEENHFYCYGKSVEVNGTNYSERGTFIDTFQTIWGCDSIIVLNIDTFSDFTCYEATYYAPNAFSPNGNTLNGKYRIRGVALKSVELQVYDRWGEKLYEGYAKEDGWDGTYKGVECQQDAYFYVARVTTHNNRRIMLKGTITLVR